ncbi:hypothetical protein GCM10010191_48220 [Actinomadura vinacea]|uniref:Uncharacterized protein n=1 Tax=Actinomadura vinacea TaxID=115336 RepID=A0ABN3JHX8_9ACTN
MLVTPLALGARAAAGPAFEVDTFYDSHVLKFPDRAAAATVRQRLKYTDLRFTNVPDDSLTGDVGDEDRYVVVTAAVSPPQQDASAKARNAFALMHAPVLNTIGWL